MTIPPVQPRPQDTDSAASRRHRGLSRRRVAPGIAAVIVVAIVVGVAGCADGARRVTLPRSVEVEHVAVPAEMRATEETVWISGDIAPAVDGLPLAIAGSSGMPGDPTLPSIWTSSDGLTWAKKTIKDVDGSFVGTLGANGEIAVLAGTLWNDGLTTAAAWQSTDRTTWDRVDIPADIAAVTSISSAHAHGDRVFTLGTDYAGEAQALMMRAGKAVSIGLPEPRKGESLRPVSLTGSPEGLLLIAEPGPEGDTAAPASYLSTDNGTTWSKKIDMSTATTDSISGVAWTGTAFVATGRSLTPEGGSRDVAAVWSSIDGRAWQREVVETDAPRFDLSGADSWLNAPTTVGETVTAIGASDNHEVSAVFRRDPDGVWRVAGVTDDNSSTGAAGMTTMLDTVPVAVVAGAGRVRSGQLTEQRWVSGDDLSARQDVALPFAATEGSETPLLSLRTSVFSSVGTGWYRSSTLSTAQFDGKRSLAVVPPSVPQLEKASDVVRGVNDEGAEVLIATEFIRRENFIRATAYFKASESSEWVEGTGFPSSGASAFDRIAFLDGGWIATGSFREQPTPGVSSQAKVWASPDGISWTEQTGEFGSPEVPSSITGLCTMPDGTPLAVGGLWTSEGHWRPAAWTRVDGVWTFRVLGAFSEKQGFAWSCTSRNDDVLISGYISGDDVILRTTNGEDWSKVFTATDGESISEPVAVSGGFAAGGAVTNRFGSVPVVWISSDGTEWTPLRLPSVRPANPGLVAGAGKDLLITMSSTAGEPVLVIRDIAAVIDERAAAPKS